MAIEKGLVAKLAHTPHAMLAAAEVLCWKNIAMSLCLFSKVKLYNKLMDLDNSVNLLSCRLLHLCSNLVNVRAWSLPSPSPSLLSHFDSSKVASLNRPRWRHKRRSYISVSPLNDGIRSPRDLSCTTRDPSHQSDTITVQDKELTPDISIHTRLLRRNEAMRYSVGIVEA